MCAGDESGLAWWLVRAIDWSIATSWPGHHQQSGVKSISTTATIYVDLNGAEGKIEHGNIQVLLGLTD